jgi:hypothetical protein
MLIIVIIVELFGILTNNPHKNRAIPGIISARLSSFLIFLFPIFNHQFNIILQNIIIIIISKIKSINNDVADIPIKSL